MTTFDAGGAMVTRREVNRMGMRPSIEALGVTEFPPDVLTTILNPFHRIASLVSRLPASDFCPPSLLPRFQRPSSAS